MSYFVPSALVNGQAKLLEGITKGEWRLPDSAVIGMIQKGLPTNPLLNDLRTREDRAVYGYMPIRQAEGAGTARAHDHTGNRGDSQSVAISWSTIQEAFSISLKQAGNNIFTFEEMYYYSMRDRLNALINRLDTATVANILAGKSGYSAGGGRGEFNTTPDVYEVPKAEENYFFQNVQSVMQFNRWNGPLMGIVDNQAGMLASRLLAQGSANATNFGFQFAGMELLKTTKSLLGSDYAGSGLFFETGAVAVLPWIPKENRKPLDAMKALEYNGDYGQMDIPELGFPIAIHTYASRGDGSAAGGYTQDLIIQVEISVDLGYLQAPLSSFVSASEECVFAFGQMLT